MKHNYIVNYGVNWSHRRCMEHKVFEFYRDANSFYKNIDITKWGSGELVKLEDGPEGKWGPAKVTVKKWYDIDNGHLRN